VHNIREHYEDTSEDGVETVEDEEGSSPLRHGNRLQAQTIVQEEERESWQDVAADRQKDVESLKRAKEVPPKLYEDDEHSIRGVQIPRSAWLVLLKLRAAGHEGYVVGGAVRDLLLKGRPKDFDILTTATTHQVKNLLHRSRLIGKRFPIVQVVVEGDMMEVSSFATGVPLSDLPFDAAALLGNRVQTGSDSITRLWHLLQHHWMSWGYQRMLLQRLASCWDFSMGNPFGLENTSWEPGLQCEWPRTRKRFVRSASDSGSLMSKT